VAAARRSSEFAVRSKRFTVNGHECDRPPRFFGIVISLNYNDHPPPHFHVRYAEQKAIVAIDSLTVLEGHLSPRELGLVVEWASEHQQELIEDWRLARQQQPLKQIAPLE